MTSQLDLFPGAEIKTPPLVRAHIIDAGAGDTTAQQGRFQCSVCNWKSNWIGFDTVAEGKRGIACPRCNKGAPGVLPFLITSANCATFENWLTAFKATYKTLFDLHGPDWGYGPDVLEATGLDGWRDYYEDGATPAGALYEDMGYWESD